MGLPDNYLFQQSQFTGNATQVSLTTSSARNSSALAPGMYLVFCSSACRIKQGGSSVTVAADTGMPLAANCYFGPIFVDSSSNNYVAGILASSTATLEIIPIS